MSIYDKKGLFAQKFYLYAVGNIIMCFAWFIYATISKYTNTHEVYTTVTGKYIDLVSIPLALAFLVIQSITSILSYNYLVKKNKTKPNIAKFLFSLLPILVLIITAILNL